MAFLDHVLAELARTHDALSAQFFEVRSDAARRTVSRRARLAELAATAGGVVVAVSRRRRPPTER